MNEFMGAVLPGIVSTVFSWLVIALLALRLSFRQAVGSALNDARELRSIHRECERVSTTPVASAMADGLVAQLEVATKDLRGHLGLTTRMRKSRDLAKMCTTAAWGIMLSQQAPAVKAEVVADLMELLNTALSSWRPDASSRAIKRFHVIASTWPWHRDEGRPP